MFTPATQFSISLINKPGTLARVCRALADEKINILAVTLMDSENHGVFRVVATNPGRTKELLQSLDLPMTETDVLSAEMPNRPGALADLCARLDHEHISIKYAYVTTGAAGGRTTGIFKVDNTKKALGLTNSRPPGRKERMVVRQHPARRGR